MQGIEIRLRDEDEAEARVLCHVPFGTDLTALVRSIGAWGVSASGEVTDVTSGQFVVDASGAYFEVIAHVEGEAS